MQMTFFFKRNRSVPSVHNYLENNIERAIDVKWYSNQITVIPRYFDWNSFAGMLNWMFCSEFSFAIHIDNPFFIWFLVKCDYFGSGQQYPFSSKKILNSIFYAWHAQCSCASRVDINWIYYRYICEMAFLLKLCIKQMNFNVFYHFK